MKHIRKDSEQERDTTRYAGDESQPSKKNFRNMRCDWGRGGVVVNLAVVERCEKQCGLSCSPRVTYVLENPNRSSVMAWVSRAAPIDTIGSPRSVGVAAV